MLIFFHLGFIFIISLNPSPLCNVVVVKSLEILLVEKMKNVFVEYVCSALLL